MRHIRSLFILLACLLPLVSPSYAQTTRSSTGTISANAGAVTINSQGMATCRFIISGTWSGTLAIKAQAADSSWVAVSAYPYAPGGLSVSSITANGQWKMDCSGQLSVQIVATAWVSGSASVSLTVSTAGGLVDAIQSTPGNFNVSPNVTYNTSAPTLTNGQSAPVQGDSAANTKTYTSTLGAGEDLTNNTLGTTPKVPVASTYSPSSYQSAVTGSQVVSGNVKNAAGVVVAVSYSNANAATRYLWITNAVTAPAGSLASSDASVVYIIAVPTATSTDKGTTFFTAAGKYFSTGISFGFSTSATSYTAGTAADHTFNVNYFRNLALSFDAVDTGSLKRFNMQRGTYAEAW